MGGDLPKLALHRFAVKLGDIGSTRRAYGSKVVISEAHEKRMEAKWWDRKHTKGLWKQYGDIGSTRRACGSELVISEAHREFLDASW